MMTALLLAQAAAAAVPGAPKITAPVVGYTLENGRLIQFDGIPGASHVTAQPDAASYSQIATATHAAATLLVPDTLSATLLFRTPLASTSVQLAERPILVAISPSATYFAVLSPSSLCLYRSSTDTLISTSTLATLSLQPQEVTAIAIGDSGEVLVTTSNAFWYSTAADQPLTFHPIGIALARFAPHDPLIIAYERQQHRIIALHPTAAFAIEPLIGQPDAPTPITGLEFARDGQSIWVSQQQGPLFNYALLSRRVTPFPALCGTLSASLAPGIFLWSQPDNQRAVLDTTRTTPTVFLVPIEPSVLSH